MSRSSQTAGAAGPTATLCGFAADVTAEDCSDDARAVATRMITDTVGVSLAAVDSDVAAAVRRGVPASGDRFAVPGGHTVGDARAAAVHTGTLAHALDYDDVHEGMGGHPSAPVLAALFPLANREGATGRGLIAAFLAGTEVEIALAEAMNPGHYERGWHPTAVVGTIGAAVGAGHLLGLGNRELRHAVGIAASEAAGIKANFGTMTKPLHVGNAARSGLEAAELAAAGFTASEDALERPFGGFCDLFRGDTPPDLDGLVADLGDPWAVVDPRIWFKAHPCCGSVQSAVAAALALREECDTTSIESITITEHPRRLDHTDTPEPTTGLEAKFSIQYCVVAAVLDGDVTLEHFEDEAVPRADIANLADRVRLRRDAATFADRDYGAAVAVRTTDGETLERTVDAPPGSAGNPMPDGVFEAKFRRCAGRALAPERVDRAWALLDDLEDLEDAGDLVAAVAAR